MRSFLISFVFCGLIAAILWASSEASNDGEKPCLKLHCTCQPERLSKAGHIREYYEFLLDTSL